MTRHYLAPRRHRDAGEPTTLVDRATDWLVRIGADRAPDPERRVRVLLRRAGIHDHVWHIAQTSVGLVMNGQRHVYLLPDEPPGELLDAVLLCDEWTAKA